MITIPKFRTASKQNIRTFALPSENQTYTFKMQYAYDSYNRIQTMTYPDGEVVSYEYNRDRMLNKVFGSVTRNLWEMIEPIQVQEGLTEPDGVMGGGIVVPIDPPVGPIEPQTITYRYPYIDSITYNVFELKDSVIYGNGTRVSYEYDSPQRLSHLRSYIASGTKMQDIAYTYDAVSNITDIANSAGTLSNGLGGTYSGHYMYDNLYRLTSANGNWYGNRSLYFENTMEYLPNGRISRKHLYADTWLNGNYTTESYTNDYHYNSSQPNTLAYIDNSNYQDFAWDRKGNMVFHHNDHSGYDRRLCWDEQNRLLGVRDEGRLSFYMYDANGERAYKLTGNLTGQNQNGHWYYYYNLDDATLYASPYLVATPKGYTKHYYAESERVASRIGGGGLHEIDTKIVEDQVFEDRCHINKDHLAFVSECLGGTNFNGFGILQDLYDWQEVQEEEQDCYWYHPDHLGSSSWITYSDGSAVQHLHYLPWGEDFVDQRSTSWNAIYTFSAKEKDVETGLSYFGSRYYSSDLSIWLSVDPMSDKYPSLSSYTYCADNPVKLVDPNGEDVWIPGLDNNGNVTYTAEKGDDHDSFVKQFNTQGKSREIFKNAGFGINSGDVKEGDVIKGDAVKKATGSEVLKGNWYNMNASQRASQIMFALMYGANKEITLPNGLYGVDLNDFINGLYSKDGGTQYNNVTIPLKGGDRIVVDMWLAPSTTIEGKNGSLWVKTSVVWGDFNDAMSTYPAIVTTAKNANAKRPMKVILFSVPDNRSNDFDNSLRR